jgi:proteic killer suppression protein
VIQSFADAATRDLWNGTNTKAARRFDRTLWPVIRRKLDMVNAAVSLADLKAPPSNRLHVLRGNLAGFYAIKVNDQYRIIFRFDKGHASEVTCTDYH